MANILRTTDVRNYWVSLAVLIGIPRVAALDTFQKLVAMYGGPERHYHGLAHVAQVLEELDAMVNHTHDRLAVETALLFHDVVYDARRNDNEEESVRFALEALNHPSVHVDLKDKVSRLILVTKHRHDEMLDDNDMQLVAGIDLAVFGHDEEAFDCYDEQIAREYAWVPPEEYRAGRVAVLQGFLNRVYIYQHPVLRARYEVQARKNIARAIARLESV